MHRPQGVRLVARPERSKDSLEARIEKRLDWETLHGRFFFFRLEMDRFTTFGSRDVGGIT